ncbi:lysophospholipid acyltransferase family protein [Maribacter aestuarii]|uniref:lysophospholipid acyltransferase family protein n=1 Tax=Maribacter aestuarii TaxID=1130723 RepID=UPI00248C8566|nr:lysophospholipid acyltransferase family protein [Maribacter aestuarii]
MKNIVYSAIKAVVKAVLHCYYKKIEIIGLENVPKDKPVLFLPNHQSALMDVLLIVTDCSRKPYFLTRSDIFGNPFLDNIFNFFRMIPIYRIRDGRDALSKNEAIFDKCADVFKGGSAIVMFPEANHHLNRSVRPLSKGFTRILFRTMEKYPDLDIQLVPVGLNYKDAISFPDEVSLYYGKPISLKDVYQEKDLHVTGIRLKETITKNLQMLTTHIPPNVNYEKVEAKLYEKNINFLNPTETNNEIQKVLKEPLADDEVLKNRREKTSVLSPLFTLLNLPLVLFWRIIVKPKVWEPEFMATMLFSTAFIGFGIYYLLIFTILLLLVNWNAALFSVLGIFLFNWLFVKYGNL